MYRRLSIDVFFATLLQHCDMVERRRDVKTITLQRRYNVVCLLGSRMRNFCIEMYETVNNLNPELMNEYLNLDLQYATRSLLIKVFYNTSTQIYEVQSK